MAATMRFGMGRISIRRGAVKRRVDGKSLHLADEVRYIQRRAADHDGRVVTVGPLARLAGSVRGCAIALNFAVSASPSDNSIARRHAAMTFHPAPLWAHATYIGAR